MLGSSSAPFLNHAYIPNSIETQLTPLSVVWDDDGIAIYFFRRDSIPDDITAGEPRPDLWGTAAARWPASSCDPYKYFYDNIAIFDTTFW